MRYIIPRRERRELQRLGRKVLRGYEKAQASFDPSVSLAFAPSGKRHLCGGEVLTAGPYTWACRDCGRLVPSTEVR